MNWTIQLRSRHDFRVSIPQKHDLLMRELATIERPFGLAGTELPAAPDPTSGVAAGCSLTRRLGRPVVCANVIYAYRADPPKAHEFAADDLFNLDYNAKRITPEQYAALIDQYLPRYITAFGAYRAELGSEQPFLDKLGVTLGRRIPIRFIHLVNYWDAALIRDAFGKTVDEVASVLAPHCSAVRRLGDGVYSILTREQLPPEDQWVLHGNLWSLLTEGRPA